MANTNRTPALFAHQILTANGYQSVAAIVVEMQAEGTAQILIDRWLQGVGLSLRIRANHEGRSISTLSPVGQALMERHEAKLKARHAA